MDTALQNTVFAKAVQAGVIPWLKGCSVINRNPLVNGVRLDFLLKCRELEVLVETKSAVLRGPNGEAMYPDCPSARGRKHVRTLIELASAGRRTAFVFIAALPGVRCFKPYREGDPVMEALIADAIKRGVEVRSLSMYMDEEGYVYIEDPDLPLCEDFIRHYRLSYNTTANHRP